MVKVIYSLCVNLSKDNSWTFTITVCNFVLAFSSETLLLWLVPKPIKVFFNFLLHFIVHSSKCFRITWPRSHFWRFLFSNSRCCKTSLFSFVLFYLDRQIGFLHYVFILVWISLLWFAFVQRWWLQSWVLMIVVIFVYYSSKCSAAQFCFHKENYEA